MLVLRFPLRFAALVFLLTAARALTAAEPPRVLTKAIEVRSLSVAEAESGIDAVIRGVVVFVESTSALFIQDDTSTTFFRTSGILPSALPTVGDEIEIRARTRMGLYLPGLDTATIRRLGRRPLPPGIPATYDDLIFGRYHYCRVTIEGIVRSVSIVEDRNKKKSLIRLALGSRVLEARVETIPPLDRDLVGHRVRVTGLAAGFINARRRQLVQPYLAVLDWSEIETLAPAPPAAEIPSISAEELLAFRVTGQGEQRVRIEGVVTAFFPPNELFLGQGDPGFAVRLVRPTDVTPGDRVVVVGFPEMERFSASVVDAELVQKSPGPAPAPVDLAAPGSLTGEFDGMLVRLDGTLRDAFRADGSVTLLIAGTETAAHVRAPETIVIPPLGAHVRATGICQVESAQGSPGFNSRPILVSLRVRSGADLEVLRAPPWWTPRRLGIVLAALAGVTLLAGLWIAVLRRQVARQTAALRRSIEVEAALEERQRIAREFHDTLEQELAGVSLRLDALATRVADDKGRSLITASRNLVSRIQTETRDLISDLRDPAENAGDLVAALNTFVARQTAEGSASLQLEAPSDLPPLPAPIVHDLRMIARESVHNAVKHGRASAITIQLAQTDAQLVLRVTDNGCGFDPATATQGKRGHFGCAGIRERARKIGATVAWHSAPQHGTTVEVTLPLAPAVEGRDGRPARPPQASTPTPPHSAAPAAPH